MSQIAYDLSQVQTRVHLIHVDMRVGLQLPCHADPLAVGRSAADLARRYYRSESTVGHEPASINVSLAQCAGCLVYGMELYGLDFMAVNELANYRVACLISDLTPDIRVANGPRLNLFKTRLSQAEALVQLVKLAEVFAVCRQLLDETTTGILVLHHDAIKRWCDDHAEIIQILTHLQERTATKKACDRAKDLILKVVRKIQDCKKRAQEPRPVPVLADAEIDYLSLPDDDLDLCLPARVELDDADLELAHCHAVVA